MKLRVLLVVLSCVLSVVTGLVLARGGKTAEAAGKAARGGLVIGVSMDTLAEERWQRDRDLFASRAKELGATEVLVQAANGDDYQQIQQVRSLITSNVDVLVIIAHNGEAMTGVVAEAQASGIPVIAYDRLIKGSDLYITFDNVKVGEMQAQYLLDTLAKKPGKKRIVRIYGAKTDNNAKLFKEGQDHVIEPAIQRGELEVVHEDWAENWTPQNAKAITEFAITKAGTNLDGILVSNDGTAGGAIQALTDSGLQGKVIVTGQDADLPACQRIVAGTQAMTIYKPLKQLALQSAALAVAISSHIPGVPRTPRTVTRAGKQEVPTVLLEVKVVTKENLEATVVEDGFHAREKLFGAK